MARWILSWSMYASVSPSTSPLRASARSLRAAVSLSSSISRRCCCFCGGCAMGCTVALVVVAGLLLLAYLLDRRRLWIWGWPKGGALLAGSRGDGDPTTTAVASAPGEEGEDGGVADDGELLASDVEGLGWALAVVVVAVFEALLALICPSRLRCSRTVSSLSTTTSAASRDALHSCSSNSISWRAWPLSNSTCLRPSPSRVYTALASVLGREEAGWGVVDTADDVVWRGVVCGCWVWEVAAVGYGY